MNNNPHRFIALLAACVALSAMGVQAQAATSCAGERFCTEVQTFKATMSDFRTSVAANYRLATARVRIENKTNRPLVLGYLQGSGVVIDNLGNRYAMKDVRAIGTITGSTFDPKFTLQPGENSEARFEFSWYAGNTIAGTTFEMELAIREIDPVAGNQFRLGREHALRFNGLSDNILAASAPSPAAATPTAPQAPAGEPVAAAAPPAPEADPCAGVARCYNAGPFIAQVNRLTTSKQANYHLVQIDVRFRNLTGQPLILAYQKGSASLVDNYGGRYGEYTRGIKGIGTVAGNTADPQFVLSPGQSRNATFEYSRYVAQGNIGTVFTPDLVIEQLEILPSQQVRSVREFSLTYANLTAGTVAVDGGGDTVEAINTINEAGRQIGEGLKSIFKKKN